MPEAGIDAMIIGHAGLREGQQLSCPSRNRKGPSPAMEAGFLFACRPLLPSHLLADILSCMPVISMFYGILIRMYVLDNKRHNLPHIHARYGEFEAAIAILDGEILSGEMPRKQLRLIQAWIELNREALDADWALAIGGENPFKIQPL
jgi:hypothetical protein